MSYSDVYIFHVSKLAFPLFKTVCFFHTIAVTFIPVEELTSDNCFVIVLFYSSLPLFIFSILHWFCVLFIFYLFDFISLFIGFYMCFCPFFLYDRSFAHARIVESLGLTQLPSTDKLINLTGFFKVMCNLHVAV